MIVDIKKFLNEKSITVPDEWIPACLHFIKAENGNNVNIENVVWMKSKVLEQWLHADLTDLASCCLPFGILKQNLATIKGQFPLQINSVKDVGLPAYSQLQKLKKCDILNEGVSADVTHKSKIEEFEGFRPTQRKSPVETEQPINRTCTISKCDIHLEDYDLHEKCVIHRKCKKAAWDPKPSRMLMLELTDGTSIVQGMEYSFIPCLSVGLKPGAKILLKGIIEVRRGVLFLTKENVSLLGGEVESLLISNAPENILNKALGLEPTDEPTIIPDKCLQLEPSQIASSTVPSQYYPTQSSQFTQKLKNDVQNTCSNWTKPISKALPGSSRGSSSTSCLKSQQKVPVSDEFDELDDFFDDETELALLEVERKMTSVSENIRSQLPKTNQTNSQSTSATRNNFSTLPYFSQTISQAKKPFQSEYSKSSDVCKSRNPQVNKIQNKNNAANSGYFPKCNLASYSGNLDNLNDSLELDDDILLAAEIVASSQLKAESSSAKSCVINVKNQTNFISAPKKLIQSKITSFSTPLKEKFGSSPNNNCSFQSQKFIKEFNDKEENTLVSRDFSSNVSTFGNSQGINKSNPQSSFPAHIKNEGNVLKRMRLSPNYEVQNVDQKIGDFKREKLDLQHKMKEMPLPYQYICLIDLNPEQRTYYTIKGFVLTLISKLEKEHEKWSLKAKINDGTGSCDVLIHHQILCRLIGMSVHDFITNKNEAKLNPALRNQMNQMVTNCQKELITMCCLLRLEVGPHLTLPVVTELIPVTNTHSQQLQSRSAS